MADTDKYSVIGQGMAYNEAHAMPWRRAIVAPRGKGSAASGTDWVAKLVRQYPRTAHEVALKSAILTRMVREPARRRSSRMQPKIEALAIVLIILSPGFAIATPGDKRERQVAMNTQSDCGKSPVQRSICMIEAVLEDIKASYPHQGGGGISDIRLAATDTYVVSIAQEERVDLVTYKLTIDAKGKVVIKERSEGTKSARP